MEAVEAVSTVATELQARLQRHMGGVNAQGGWCVSLFGRKHRHSLPKWNPASENLSQVIKILVLSSLLLCPTMFCFD